MYPEELKRFIQERNNLLGGNDLIRATSTEENPQLIHITYNTITKSYEIWDRYGNYISFKAIEYTDEDIKKLIKRRNDYDY